jgi:hypothetical protein
VTIQLDSSAAEIDHIPHGTIVEIVGQVQGPTQVAVRCCLSLLLCELFPWRFFGYHW